MANRKILRRRIYKLQYKIEHQCHFIERTTYKLPIVTNAKKNDIQSMHTLCIIIVGGVSNALRFNLKELQHDSLIDDKF